MDPKCLASEKQVTNGLDLSKLSKQNFDTHSSHSLSSALSYLSSSKENISLISDRQ